jgi:hypothetical protein
MKAWLWKGMLAAAIFLPLVGGATGQAATPEHPGQERRGIEGVWDVTITVVQCDTSKPLFSGRAILMFGEDGRLTSVTDNFLHSATLGTWRHLRGQSYTATDIFFVFNADGSLGGSQEVTREIELGTNANEYTATATFQIFNTSDQVISTGCATSTATRLFE